MRVGFTGSQNGLTNDQQGVLLGLLRQYGMRDWLIHGGCVGADTEAHFLGRQQGMKIKVWPSNIKGKWGDWPDAEMVMAQMPPLERNMKIVIDNLDHLYACPGTSVERMRSGTWATVRYARRQLVDHSIILPDGHVDTVVYVKPVKGMGLIGL